MPEKEKLSRLPMLTPSDYIEFIKPDGIDMTGYLGNQYKIQQAEFTQLTGKQAPLQPRLMRNKLTGQLTALLPKPELQTVLFSRLIPLVSPGELAAHHQACVVFLGLSTNSPVALNATRLGIGPIIGFDGDLIETSNVARLAGATLEDVGTNKAVNLGYLLCRINPDVNFRLYPRHATIDDIRALLPQATVIVEMVDNLAFKLAVREAAKTYADESGRVVPILMGSGKDFAPSFSNGPLPSVVTRAMIEHISKPDTQLVEIIRSIIAASGKDTITDRLMVHFILAAANKLPHFYLAQTGPTADAVAAVLSFQISAIARGVPVPAVTELNLPELALSPESRLALDEQYFREMCGLYPDLFQASHGSLHANVEYLMKSVLNI